MDNPDFEMRVIAICEDFGYTPSQVLGEDMEWIDLLEYYSYIKKKNGPK